MAKFAKFESNRSVEEAVAIYNQRIVDAKIIYEKHKDVFFVRACPFCGSTSHEACEAFHETYQIVRCRKCASEFVNPCPPKEAIADYYENCISNRQSTEVTSQRKTTFNIDDRIPEIEAIISNQLGGNKTIKILEVGCSSGLFLSNLRNYLLQKYSSINFEISGIDLDSDAIANKVDESISLSCNSAESLNQSGEHENNSYDLIVHYELIEHLADPFGFMVTVKRLLKQNGFCIFTTPNSHGAENLAVAYNSRRLLAHSIFPPMHLNGFNTTNISVFSYRLGFDLYKVTTPGKLDVDMICINKDYLTNDDFKRVANLSDESVKELIQEYTIACLASSHMQCILRKSTS